MIPPPPNKKTFRDKQDQKKATLDAVKQWKRGFFFSILFSFFFFFSPLFILSFLISLFSDGGGDMDDGFLDTMDKGKKKEGSSSKGQDPSRKRKSSKQQAKVR